MPRATQALRKRIALIFDFDLALALGSLDVVSIAKPVALRALGEGK